MKSIAPQGELADKVLNALSKAPLFEGLSPEHLERVVEHARVVEFEPGEHLIELGGPSDSFFVILSGKATVFVGDSEDLVQVGNVGKQDTIGEMGVLLNQPRGATVTATERLVSLQFTAQEFDALFDKVPAFARTVCSLLAGWLGNMARLVPLPSHTDSKDAPPPAVLSLLSAEVIQRHRVLPLSAEGNVITIGFVTDPTAKLVTLLRRTLPGTEIKPVRISDKAIDDALANIAGVADLDKDSARSSSPPIGSPKLDALLRRMVAEGASDLHLSAGQRPVWRLHGDIKVLNDLPVLGGEMAIKLLGPVMEARHIKQFEDESDVDFAYAIENLARFRVNMFQDARGACAVLRQIPDKILTMDQLGLPAAVRELCELPKGLVLVTGPTGSGKSTTLATMIDHINRTRAAHIITLEDPVEFVHKSRMSLVNQREIGSHSRSFARAMRAGLREDPDIVLVGEMRDLETISLAMETANTGHLVFGTLHTATAISTMDRVINSYPADEQSQVRATLADTLKGVIAQTLCRRVGGGRVAAFEIMLVNFAISNLIREGKTFQIGSQMEMGRSRGNSLLNDELAKLIKQRLITAEEALEKSPDKTDLRKRAGMQ